jgi:Raf kinase inhibitor-like YbhB/YbcL family protein
MKKFLILLMSINLYFILNTSVFANTLLLDSSSIASMSKLDTLYTCDGTNISPELEWKNPPKKTVSFAIILSDPDATQGTFYHWILFNLPKTTTKLNENINKFPVGAQIAKNSWGNKKYQGPCPPKGSEHRYIISLYALNTTLSLPDDADAVAILNAMQNHILDVTELKFNYSH